MAELAPPLAVFLREYCQTPRQAARQAARAPHAITLQVAVAHLQVQEPIHLAAVLQEAQLRVDSGRLRRLQGQGRGQSGGSRQGLARAFHGHIITVNAGPAQPQLALRKQLKLYEP